MTIPAVGPITARTWALETIPYLDKDPLWKPHYRTTAVDPLFPLVP